MLVGVLITTFGILLLTLGLVGASIEVYRRLLSAIVQQQVSALTQQLPAILRPEGATAAEGARPPLDSTRILGSLIGNLITTPLWLVLAVLGVALIYLGLCVTQRQGLRRRP